MVFITAIESKLGQMPASYARNLYVTYKQRNFVPVVKCDPGIALN